MTPDSAIQCSVHDGLIPQQTAAKMIDAADRHIDELTHKLTDGSEAVD